MNSITSAAVLGSLESLAMMPWRMVFPGRHELLATLLDGAQRSGASAIDIEYQESLGVLRLRDNGSLPNGPRALSAVRTGMLSTPEEFSANRPDLLRYAAMLACTKRLKIQTAAHSVTIEPEHFIRDGEVRPARISSVLSGVQFALDLLAEHRCTAHRLNEEIKALVRGFPLPVSLNGQPLPRPYAISARVFTPFAHGAYCIDQALAEDEHHVFLAGLPIESSEGRPAYLPGGTIVHLHPEIFQFGTPGHRGLDGGAITLAFLRHEIQLLTGYCVQLRDDDEEEAWHGSDLPTQ